MSKRTTEDGGDERAAKKARIDDYDATRRHSHIPELAEPYDAVNGPRRYELRRPTIWIDAVFEDTSRLTKLSRPTDTGERLDDREDTWLAYPRTVLLSHLLFEAWTGGFCAYEFGVDTPINIRDLNTRLRFGDTVVYISCVFHVGHMLPHGAEGYTHLVCWVPRGELVLELLSGPERELLNTRITVASNQMPPEFSDAPLVYLSHPFRSTNVAVHDQRMAMTVPTDEVDPTSVAGEVIRSAVGERDVYMAEVEIKDGSLQMTYDLTTRVNPNTPIQWRTYAEAAFKCYCRRRMALQHVKGRLEQRRAAVMAALHTHTPLPDDLRRLCLGYLPFYDSA